MNNIKMLKLLKMLKQVISQLEQMCLKVGLNLKFDYKMQFLFLEKSETSGIEESHDMSF